ncbi:hypothetical protein [Nitrosopumilus sp.]|uniref:hypothetical protein n=1 Tax=Nitrosopumilus sp. TaxID=2024843 RepID=UPI003B5B6D8F
MNKILYPNMPKRVTIMIGDDNYKKLRGLQAKLLKDTTSSVSFSQVVNNVITSALKGKA